MNKELDIVGIEMVKHHNEVAHRNERASAYSEYVKALHDSNVVFRNCCVTIICIGILVLMYIL